MTDQTMTPEEVLDAIDGMLPESWDAGLQEPSAAACDRLARARTAVAALIARNAELEADNKALRAAYHKARNAAAGFSNYCEESANSRRCERELAEAERMFRDIDDARAEAGHG